MITIRLTGNADKHVAFAYSPLLECVLSLHVLFAPQHHALLHDWVRRMRAIDPALKRRIEAFAFLFHWHVPDLLLPGGHEPRRFESEVERLFDYPAELLLEEFGRPLYDHGGRHGEGVYDEPRVRDTMLRRAATYGPPSRRLAEDLLADPLAFVRAFVSLLEDYWTSAFRAEWQQLEPRLAASVNESRRLLGATDVWSVLGRLPPNCHTHARRQELRIDLPHDHTVEVSASSRLVLIPSVFVWPHLRVNCDDPWPVSIIYATPEMATDAKPRIPPAELVETLRALADDTRLRVLRLIAERPRTTQELAPLVGLSPAGLSKTLRRLAAAGLVTTHREGYYVVYSLASDRVDAVSKALSAFLE